MKKRFLILSAVLLTVLQVLAQIPVAGTWTGTCGQGVSQTGFPYSLRFNGDASLNVLDPNGNVICNGNFSFSYDNKVTALYFYQNQRISLNGTYDPAKNIVSGTGESSIPATNNLFVPGFGGKFGWIMTTKQVTPPTTTFTPRTNGNLTKTSPTSVTKPVETKPVK